MTLDDIFVCILSGSFLCWFIYQRYQNIPRPHTLYRAQAYSHKDKNATNRPKAMLYVLVTVTWQSRTKKRHQSLSSTSARDWSPSPSPSVYALKGKHQLKDCMTKDPKESGCSCKVIISLRSQLYHPLAPGPELVTSFLCVIMGSLSPKVSMISCQVCISIDRIAWCFAAPCRVGSSSSSASSLLTGAAISFSDTP